MNVPWEALVTVALYMIASTVGFIWWMAVQTITLQFVREDLKVALELLAKADATYATKIDVAKDISNVFKQIDALWKKSDKHDVHYLKGSE